MALRVTQGMMHAQLMSNLNTNLSKMSTQQDQISTGRKINKASDDPNGITYGLRYRSDLAGNAQYQSNVASAQSWLDFNDTQLDQATQILQRVTSLATQASTGTNTQDSLDAINKEIAELKNQMTDIANSSFNGKYVFGGQRFDQKPFPAGADAKGVAADGGDVTYAISESITLNVNLKASDVFGAADAAGSTDNVFSVFDRLSAALSTSNYGAIGGELDTIKSRMNKIISARAENGARTNRAELMDNRLKDMNISLTALQSKTEDADVEKLFLDSTVSQNVYQASLSVGAKIIMPSLVNFLN
ncbi:MULTISPECIES: flagellar hook-associated protein FlgL [unclassified Paenibacillus]|uniref:flagellar hook-associated protein FlgL n=1 Tax=unclassified Paenibacillus TaxID=185978 RepID=UPI0009548663|nr:MULTISPECIES: flagellar hook-associated protein FlgL [unclassified Paenibacillus]ASS67237.1 flagellar hook-associated protein 3 [Paenibacillus sp. RUD330]SIQ84683.1 flagellar hook-associated protein 3 FlgL [Paenibacillus sp. RU4X]SIR05535.1 flagellar hook-associated protein 3 FlgL [Paenibacillus sp. RU4T]